MERSDNIQLTDFALRVHYWEPSRSLHVILTDDGVILDAVNGDGEVVGSMAMLADEWFDKLTL